MVKKSFVFVFILLPFFLFSADFMASVNKKQIGLEESLTLLLTLKDASAQGSPSIESLKKDFSIRSSQQSSSTIVMNGSRSTSVTWTIVLLPQQEGEIVIPSISINSSSGVLKTNSLTIKVLPQAATGTKSQADEMVFTTTTSTNHPYKNETFFLTLTLNSKIELVNVSMPKFSIDEAIVELNGEPSIEKKLIDGVKHSIVTFNYLVTPLNAGVLHIPAIRVEGAIPAQKQSQGHAFLDTDFEPLFMMNGFNRLQLFTKTSSSLTLNVQPAITEMIPWLPARNLAIEEIWDPSQKLEEGEPLTRTIKIVAEGILANQLPDLSENQAKNPLIKMYADKPILENKVIQNTIHSYRTEQYTLIPQQPGSLELPEITLEWWDVQKHEKRIAVLPAKSIEILPKMQLPKETTASGAVESEGLSESEKKLNHDTDQDLLLYGVIAVLGLLLIIALLWVARLQKQILQKKRSPKETVSPLPPIKSPLKSKTLAKSKDKNEKLPDLNPT